VKELLRKVRQAVSPRQPKYRVICDESGFTVVDDGKTLARVAWAEVLEIFAYKQDLLTMDMICLGFRVKDDGTFRVVSEEDLGYKEFLAELPRRFSGLRTDWFETVAYPAFATNRTTLWGQPWKAEQG
jgi:hypothetical protein